ncbi:MAG TPA: carboxylesterase family protein [Chitinophagaceae bacterium]|nr:carboxylesterase family protein [Chitinophagaceae bacterium]
MRIIFIFVYLILIAPTGFTQSYPYCIGGRFAENDFYSPIAIESEIDLVYGYNTNASGNIDSLRLDIYYPNKIIDGLAARPMIVMIHGGGFLNGSKTDMTNYCQELARRGYVAATIDYRVGWNSGTSGTCSGNIPSFKSAMYRATQDVNAAIRYLSFHALDYKADKNTIFLAGQSEGGMIALNAGFLDQLEADGLLPGVSSDLGGLLDATNNINTSYSIKGIFNWCGGLIDTNMIEGNEKIPVLSIHGLLDTLMPADTGYYLNCNNTSNPYPLIYGPKQIFTRMKNLGICTETNFDEMGFHCVFPSLEPIVYIPAKFTCFFKNILCGTCNTQSKIGYNAYSCMDAAPLSIVQPTEQTKFNLIYYHLIQQLDIELNFPTSHFIDIELYNAIGQKVSILETKKQINGYQLLQYKMPQLRSGLYFVNLKFDGVSQSKRFVIE